MGDGVLRLADIHAWMEGRSLAPLHAALLKLYPGVGMPSLGIEYPVKESIGDEDVGIWTRLVLKVGGIGKLFYFFYSKLEHLAMARKEKRESYFQRPCQGTLFAFFSLSEHFGNAFSSFIPS